MVGKNTTMVVVVTVTMINDNDDSCDSNDDGDNNFILRTKIRKLNSLPRK